MADVEEIARYERLSGSKEEMQAFLYIERQLHQAGIATKMMQHGAYVSLPVSCSLRVVSPVKTELVAITHSFGLSTEKPHTAELVHITNFDKHQDLAGKFLLIDGIASPEKAVWATQKHAAGVVWACSDEEPHHMIISPVWGNPDDLTITNLPKIYAASVGRDARDTLLGLLNRSRVHISLETEVHTEWTKIPLLVAEIPAASADPRFLMLSGHVDSWYYGAMDNGSANATMLEVARLVSKHRDSLRRALRLCFWSGHSHARYAGSCWYADNLRHEIEPDCVLHVNVDSTGAVGATDLCAAPVMAEAYELASRAIFRVSGQRLKPTRMQRNGDQSFWGIGVPAMFVSLSTQPEHQDGPPLGVWWHTSQDLPDKIDPENLVRDTKIYLEVCWEVLTKRLLPLDYCRVMDEWRQELERMREHIAAYVDLQRVLYAIDSLKLMLHEMHESAESTSDERINECIMRLGRTLIPVNYTRYGSTCHDAAVAQPAFPLFGVKPCASEHERHLYSTRMKRAENRVFAALCEAMCCVSRVLQE
jgi:hypothetical protein